MRMSIVFVLVATSLAAADPAPTSAQQMHVDDCARARAAHKTCVIDMGKGDTVDGSTVRPDGMASSLIKFGSNSSLIRIRRDFISEIIKSAEDL
jgi:hypothetical protein